MVRIAFVIRANVSCVAQIVLNHTQAVGLAYAEDKKKRIPREECKAVTDIVQAEASRRWPGTVAVCCGARLTISAL